MSDDLVTVSRRVLDGLDASRRAAWRAYYELRESTERHAPAPGVPQGVVDRVAAVVQEHGPISRRGIGSHMPGYRISRVMDALRVLIEDRRVACAVGPRSIVLYARVEEWPEVFV